MEDPWCHQRIGPRLVLSFLGKPARARLRPLSHRMARHGGKWDARAALEKGRREEW